MQVARQGGESGVKTYAFKNLADIGDPERALEAGADVLPALGNAQWDLLALRFLQTLFDLRGRKAADANHFISAGFAGGYGNRRTRNSQKFCEESNTSVIGLAI